MENILKVRKDGLTQGYQLDCCLQSPVCKSISDKGRRKTSTEQMEQNEEQKKEQIKGG